MEPDSATEPDFLPLAVEEQIDRACVRFEQAWQAGSPPPLRPYLEEVAGEWHARLLHEMLRIDLEYRERRGETPDPSEYLVAYPDLCAALREAMGSHPALVPLAERVTLARVEQTPAPATDPSPPGLESPSGEKSPKGAWLHPISLGGYRIEKLLKAGGMGAVYLAHDDRLGRAIALKTMRPDISGSPNSAERFLREARSAARVEHDNVIPIWQVGEDSGTPFIAMPLLQGESLADRLHREPVSPSEMILKVGREVAEGLAAAHARNVIHRDVKPGNIWLEGDPESLDPEVRFRRCKVLDFGLARPIEENTALTFGGEVVGTPAYMSPEQARAEIVDHRTDLFSLGALLYRMATGDEPFSGPTLTALLTALAIDEPIPPSAKNPTVSPELEALILRLLSKRPEDRPRSAREVADAFAALGAPSPPPTDRRRMAWAVGVLGLMLVFVVVLGIRTILRPGQQVVPSEKAADNISIPPVQETRRDPMPDPIQANRRAAEWVLRCGGKVGVKVGAVDKQATTLEELPPGSFFLENVDLYGCQKLVTDAGLENLKGLTRLTSLSLAKTDLTNDGLKNLEGMTQLTWLSLLGVEKVTDAGVEHLQGLTGLRRLYLFETGVSDDGLKYLKGMTQLESLGLGQTKVTGLGLEQLQDLTHLYEINLFGTPLSNEALSHLRGLPGLTHLVLMMTPLTDAGLENLKGRVGLKYLSVSKTKVTDAGMKHIAELKKIFWLEADDLELTDEGLNHLKTLPNLRNLQILNTRVTAAGVESLKLALPGCAVTVTTGNP